MQVDYQAKFEKDITPLKPMLKQASKGDVRAVLEVVHWLQDWIRHGDTQQKAEAVINVLGKNEFWAKLGLAQPNQKLERELVSGIKDAAQVLIRNQEILNGMDPMQQLRELGFSAEDFEGLSKVAAITANVNKGGFAKADAVENHDCVGVVLEAINLAKEEGDGEFAAGAFSEHIAQNANLLSREYMINFSKDLKFEAHDAEIQKRLGANSDMVQIRNGLAKQVDDRNLYSSLQQTYREMESPKTARLEVLDFMDRCEEARLKYTDDDQFTRVVQQDISKLPSDAKAVLMLNSKKTAMSEQNEDAVSFLKTAWDKLPKGSVVEILVTALIAMAGGAVFGMPVITALGATAMSILGGMDSVPAKEEGQLADKPARAKPPVPASRKDGRRATVASTSA